MKNDAGLTASFLFEPRLNEKPGHTERHQKIGNDPRDSARFSHRRQNHSARERPEPVNFWHTLTPLPLASTSATRLRSSSERALQQQLATHYNISGDTGTLSLDWYVYGLTSADGPDAAYTFQVKQTANDRPASQRSPHKKSATNVALPVSVSRKRTFNRPRIFPADRPMRYMNIN